MAGRGENVRIKQRTVLRAVGERYLEFKVDRAPVEPTDVHLQEREITVQVPPLPEGRVRIEVVYKEDPAFPAPCYAALDGRMLRIR